jgi:outer membrane protein OmpA-like peptidoglycan-associated protein
MSSSDDMDFTATLADFMSGVAIIFLCLAVTYIVISKKQEVQSKKDYDRIMKEKTEREDKVKLLVQELSGILGLPKGEGVSSENDCFKVVGEGYKVTIRFKETSKSGKCRGINFPSGDFHVQGGGQSLHSVDEVSKHICSSLVSKDNNIVDRIELLGHTDCTTYWESARILPKDSKILCKSDTNNQHCGNIWLSSMRAREVYLHLWKSANSKEQGCLASTLKIAGRGSFEPIDKSSQKSCANQIDEEKRKNRRVELVVHITPPSV